MANTDSGKRISDAAATVWAYVQNWAARGITLIVFFVLARLLTPAEFGAFAVAMIFLTFGEIFVEQLFGHAIVQRDTLTEAHRSSAFWVTLMIGATLALATLLAAPAFAAAFDSPGVEPIIMALTPVFGFMAVSSVPSALLRRALDYRTLARRTALSNLLSGIVAIVAAAGGLGVWTFVVQQLVFQAVSTAVLWRHEAWRPQLVFDRKALGELFGFASRITLVKVLDLVETRVLELVIARYLGVVALGHYALASRAQQSATQLLAAPLWESSISVFARRQNDRKSLTAAFEDRVLLAALLIMPAFLLAAASAEALVPAVFGEQWHEAVAPFQILCVLGALRSIAFVFGAAMQAVGAASISVWMALTRTAVILASLPYLISYGVAGAAICVFVGQLAVIPIVIAKFARTMGFSGFKVLKRIFTPIFVSILSSSLCWWITKTYVNKLPGGYVVLIAISFSTFTVLIIYAVLMRKTFNRYFCDLAGVRRRVRLSGAFGEANFGDDLLMLASYHYFASRREGLTIYVTVSDYKTASYVKKHLPKAVLEKRHNSLRSAWALEVMAGGTQFFSLPKNVAINDELPSRFNLLINKFNPRRIVPFAIRRIARLMPVRPVRVAVGLGVGPFRAGNEEASKRVLSQMSRIWLRDTESREFPNKWGLVNVEDGADICFANNVIGASATKVDVDQKLIGVVIRGWEFAIYSEGYQESLLLTCRALEDSGLKVKFFSFCASIDREAIKYFDRSGFQVEVWDPFEMEVSDYLNSLARCAFFISARFHGVVVGAVLGKPSIGIELDPKVRQICGKLGLSDFVWSSPFNKDNLFSRAISMAENYESVADRVAVGRKREGGIADQMMLNATFALFE
ncbi:oligosaccharide flippase family protein [Aromatoleum evansii]|uniref:Oligosaccharide flippase family protein n=1 Tax=Aromatoleum evansii TaxID=59406 RepID=A0ABZ1AGZ1_AROEV|nr:oligosaccharide flippase family protein [Aromatoleum evansii]